MTVKNSCFYGRHINKLFFCICVCMYTRVNEWIHVNTHLPILERWKAELTWAYSTAAEPARGHSKNSTADLRVFPEFHLLFRILVIVDAVSEDCVVRRTIPGHFKDGRRNTTSLHVGRTSHPRRTVVYNRMILLWGR